MHAFTTGSRKLIDFTAKDGKIINFLINLSKNDGAVLFTKSGVPVVVDKQLITLEAFVRLGIPEEYIPDHPLRITQDISDFITFTELVQSQGLSASSNILFIKNGEPVAPVNDTATARRFHIEFVDGTFAMFTSLQPNDNTKHDITCSCISSRPR